MVLAAVWRAVRAWLAPFRPRAYEADLMSPAEKARMAAATARARAEIEGLMLEMRTILEERAPHDRVGEPAGDRQPD